MADLIVTEENGIVWASINVPSKGSSISRAVTDDYIAALRRVADEPGLKGLIWTSESEKVFSGGVDLKVPDGIGEAEAGPYRVGIVRDMIDATLTCPRPIVVMARGKMLGAAFMNALLTDRIVADETASFRMPEVRIGIASPYNAAIVESITNAGLAYDICLSSRAIPARELEQRGGPCTVVSAELLRQAAVDTLESLAAMPRESYAYMKRWFQAARIEKMKEALRYSDAVPRG